jgi:predicted nucleic acid-binding protein
MAEDAPETILCDTSFVGIQERGKAATAHWDRVTVARLDAAILAISVFALAEIRGGRIYAGWGQARCDRQEARLAAFLHIPLDEGIMDVYAELHAWARKGNPTPHNDLWIAATALSRRIPLVSCDRDFERIAGGGFTLEHIYLPPAP